MIWLSPDGWLAELRMYSVWQTWKKWANLSLDFIIPCFWCVLMKFITTFQLCRHLDLYRFLSPPWLPIAWFSLEISLDRSGRWISPNSWRNLRGLIGWTSPNWSGCIRTFNSRQSHIEKLVGGDSNIWPPCNVRIRRNESRLANVSLSMFTNRH